jgi:hypothetical protein
MSLYGYVGVATGFIRRRVSPKRAVFLSVVQNFENCFEVGFGLLAMAFVAVLVAVDIRLVSASAFAGVSTNNR